MSQQELIPVTVGPEGVSQAQIRSMYPGTNYYNDHVFRTTDRQHAMHPYVDVRTSDYVSNRTLIRVNSPFSERMPGDDGRYPADMLEGSVIRPDSANLDVYLPGKPEQVSPATLRVCGAAVLAFSTPEGYLRYLDENVTMTEFGDIRTYETSDDEALWTLQMIDPMSVDGPAETARNLERFMPNEHFVAQRPDGTSSEVEFGTEQGITLISVVSTPLGERHPVEKLNLYLDDMGKNRDISNLAHAAASLAFRIADSISSGTPEIG